MSQYKEAKEIFKNKETLKDITILIARKNIEQLKIINKFLGTNLNVTLEKAMEKGQVIKELENQENKNIKIPEEKKEKIERQRKTFKQKIGG